MEVNHLKAVILCLSIYISMLKELTMAVPVSQNIPAMERDKRDPGFGLERNPDGSVTGSFSLANSIGAPGMSDSFAVADSFTMGPKGMSFSNSDSMSSDIGGMKNGFSNAMASSFGPGGMSNAFANAGSVSNPLFQSSFANANANSMSMNNPFSGNRNFNSPSGIRFK